MSGNIYYLIENYDPLIDYKDGTVVALTPQACYELGKRGIKYGIMEDFYSEDGLKGNAEAYFFEQLKWFDKFDNYLKENIRFCADNNLNLATAHYNQLKYFFDSTIANAYILRNFIEKNNPSRVIHVSAHPQINNDHSVYNLFKPGFSLLAQLLPHICKRFGITIESAAPYSAKTISPQSSPIKDKIKELLIKLQFKAVLNFIRFKKYRQIRKSNKINNDLNIMFLHSGCISIDQAIVDAISSGAKVFTMSNSSIVKENSFIQKVALSFGVSEDNKFISAIKKDCNDALQNLDKQEFIFGWINDKCLFDLSDFLTPYLKYFISNICCEDMVKIKKLRSFYDREKINMIIARASTGRESAVVLSASENFPNIKKVCLQHSCTVLDGLLLQKTDLGCFDYYVTTDSLSEEYFNICGLSSSFKNCKVTQSPHYFKEVQNGYKAPKAKIASMERIMYAPTDLDILGTYNFNNEYYAGTWYYNFLIGLVDHFSECRDKVFIFKYSPGGMWVNNSIVPYISNKKYKNILVENRPLIDCFRLADRVILDYPSTGLFESAAVGIPVLALYRESLKTWDEALSFFGKSLQPFSDTKSAIEKIDSFLNDDKESYIVNLPIVQKDISRLIYDIYQPKDIANV